MTALATLTPGQVVAQLAARRVARAEHLAQLAEDDRVIAELELLESLDSEAAVLPRRRLPAATAMPQRGGRRPWIVRDWPPPEVAVDDISRLARIRLLMHSRDAA